MKLDWSRSKLKRTTEDCVYINYWSEATYKFGYVIQSQRRKIPHANRSGTWEHTTFVVLKDSVKLCEKHTLAAAKKYVEEMPEVKGA